MAKGRKVEEVVESDTDENEDGNGDVVKKGRGRPRKYPVGEGKVVKEKVKRGLGRPRKDAKGRGRPRKHPKEEEDVGDDDAEDDDQTEKIEKSRGRPKKQKIEVEE